MVSRPAVLVLLLVILIVTSQFEWKQQLVNEMEYTSNNKKRISSREELVKDKIILSQEKMIQRLNEFIHNIQQQLRQCRGSNVTVISSGASFSSYIRDIQRQQDRALDVIEDSAEHISVSICLKFTLNNSI